MNSGISKKVIVLSFFFINFIQSSHSAESHKIHKSEDNQANLLRLTRTLKNNNSSNLLLNNGFQIIPLDKKSLEENSNQLLNYTNIIKQNSMNVKKDIIEHLWKVIISDNSIDQYEANLMRRICGLIYFPDKECAEIKLKLLNSK